MLKNKKKANNNKNGYVILMDQEQLWKSIMKPSYRE